MAFRKGILQCLQDGQQRAGLSSLELAFTSTQSMSLRASQDTTKTRDSRNAHADANRASLQELQAVTDSLARNSLFAEERFSASQVRALVVDNSLVVWRWWTKL